MNKILMKRARRLQDYIHGEVLVVPFTCSDVPSWAHLHEPAYNRSPAENAMAEDIMTRLRRAVDTAGFEIVNFSFSSMTLTLKPTNPVN
jgi:hypothetical protein